MHPRCDDPAQFAQQVEQVCALYAQAKSLRDGGVHVLSCDEMSGIQALERAAPSLPLQPGHVERREFEYIRHGTLSLIANFEVATGRIVTPTLGPSRTEEDFVAHVRQSIASDPAAEWVFITDNLNTHQSEGLVRLVAVECGLNVELGEKGKCGILATLQSRAAFLGAQSHRVRFVYTPKHCSWLNQIEIWFSILVRRLLRRASFACIAELALRILEFIAYFNRTMARAFKWTYAGRPLVV